jgi:serine/threonine-protein kinase
MLTLFYAKRAAERCIMTLIAQRYQILETLGQGGMGTVYRAADTQSGIIVALKQIRPDLVADDPEMIARFIREGEVLRELNHPNIVRMLAAGEDDSGHYLVMEYVTGGSLYDLLKRQPRLPIGQTLSIALELADALSRAHHLKIIHRDLKPANVLIAEDGTPRLTDFGIAKTHDARPLTQTGIAIGTIDYLSPEALAGETVDTRTDVWAFGVMLFEMLAGKRPFEASNLTGVMTAILMQPVPDLEALRPDAPTALVDLVYRMLEKDRQHLEQHYTECPHIGARIHRLTC